MLLHGSLGSFLIPAADAVDDGKMLLLHLLQIAFILQIAVPDLTDLLKVGVYDVYKNRVSGQLHQAIVEEKVLILLTAQGTFYV